ncbi:MAG: CsbD family protein [Candidatus Dormibacteraeota bacterium]|uniref:CsbD family protein n=1 Tax=Candidatus Amunia macphersoniae TaxID=3127014 RepID=A0A934KJW0_9BACT|nr:CsbD family protein [Candidatus Dormibacteraeota bacterium]
MSFADKAKNKAEELAGKVKEKTGAVAGNEDLEADGQADQAKAGVKQGGEHLKDVAGDAKNSFTKD